MRLNDLKILLCGAAVLSVSGCTYSAVYDPWFDENSSLYEDMQVIDVTKERPPLDTSYEKAEENVYVAEQASYGDKKSQSADKTFIASPMSNVTGTLTVEKKANVIEKTSFVSAYIPYLKDSARLDSKDRKGLTDTAKICKKHNCSLRVIAYAGKNNKNYETLVEKRALEIRKFLTENGVPYDKIKLQPEKDTNVGNFAEVVVEY